MSSWQFSSPFRTPDTSGPSATGGRAWSCRYLFMEDNYCPPFPKPRDVPGDVDGGDILRFEEGGVAEIEEALQVRRVVMVRAFGGHGLDQARSCFP